MASITFIDHNPHRDHPPPRDYMSPDLRLIYDRIWDGTTVIASFVEGTATDGSDDGWRIATNGDLYSDVNMRNR